MNFYSKTLIATLSLALIAGLFACTSAGPLTMDADDVAGIAAEIAEFDLPAGYSADFAASMMGYSVASYRPGDDHSHLYLIQSEKGADKDDLETGLKELIPGASDQYSRMRVVETLPVTIREQETTLIISEGLNSENGRNRQVMVAFDGKGGPALLVLSEPVERWDQAQVNAFLASIR